MMRTRRSRRDLPHWQRLDGSAIYWITFRLADSLPQDKITILKKERERFLLRYPKPWTQETEAMFKERFNDRIQEWLDAGYGSCLLGEPHLREYLVEAILKFDGVRHFLVSAVIMPNHVHLVLRVMTGDLSDLLGGIKGASARRINEVTGRTGSRLWMEECYDHIIRSEEELQYLRNYIRENPARLPAGKYWLLDRDPPFGLKSDPELEVLYAVDYVAE